MLACFASCTHAPALCASGPFSHRPGPLQHWHLGCAQLVSFTVFGHLRVRSNICCAADATRCPVVMID